MTGSHSTDSGSARVVNLNSRSWAQV